MQEVWELCPVRDDFRCSIWTEEFQALLNRWKDAHDKWRELWPTNDEHGMAKWGLDAYQATYLLVLAKDTVQPMPPFNSELLSNVFPANLKLYWIRNSEELAFHLSSYHIAPLFEMIADPSTWNSNGALRLGDWRNEVFVRPDQIPSFDINQIKRAWLTGMGLLPAFFAHIDEHIRAEGGYEEDAFIVNWNTTELNIYLSHGRTLLHLKFPCDLSSLLLESPILSRTKLRPPVIVRYNVRRDVRRITREGCQVRLQFHGEHMDYGQYVRNGPITIKARNADMARRLHDYLEGSRD